MRQGQRVAIRKVQINDLRIRETQYFSDKGI